MKIGFIGLGIMGKPMSKNLLKAGHELVVCDFNKDAVAEVVAAGAKEGTNGAEIAKECDVIITMLPNSPHVRTVALGEGGIIEGAHEGTVLIDMSSIDPVESKKIGAELAKKGIDMLDAPVSGGEPKAIDGTLSVMVGGKKELFDKYYDMLMVMAGSVVYVGELGSGNVAKLANQIMIAGTLSGVCEALTYAKEKGLDPDTFMKSVATGAAGSRQLDLYGAKIIAGDYAPGFFMKHFIKDMKLALIEANKSGIDLGVLSQVLANCEELEAEGCGELGTQALMKFYDEEHRYSGEEE